MRTLCRTSQALSDARTTLAGIFNIRACRPVILARTLIVNMATLADIVLVLHALVVVFNVGGLAAIWIGAALDWRWIRNFWFRVIHLGSMGVVAAGSLLGMICPLTVLEDALRQAGPPQSGFIQRLVSRLLYYDLPASV